MTLIPVFNVSLLWTSSDTDAKPCLKCEQIIYGKMWHPVVQFAEDKIEDTVFTPIEVRLCAPCYNRFVK